MLIELRVPPLAESVSEATLLEWHKQTGDRVTRGENLLDLETDKVTLEVPSPESGVLKEIRKRTGEPAVAGEVLALIDSDGASAEREEQRQTQSSHLQAPDIAPATAEVPKLSPSVRKILSEHKLSPEEIPSSGKGGRLTRNDVLSYLQAQPPAAPQALAEPLPNKPEEEQPAGRERRELEEEPTGRERREPMSRLRRRIAERLLAAQRENALLTTFNEVNMQAVVALRQHLGAAFEQQHGVRLGFMSFFVKTSVQALKRFPLLNASIDGEDILYHDYYDLGIAVSSPRGLVVPVLREADHKSFAEIEQEIRLFGQKAQESTLALEELSGGTFTITNGGVFGSLLSTPIVNPPQSAILGMHKISERPVVENGEIVIRPIMYLALSYDHRLIDGRHAVQFLVTIKEQLEDPNRMLLGIGSRGK
ncbi:MAG: 2-oxoglutarate dehydrogenase complex dihydrolipoyllysine-residue succinyltransferase [Gammaproteobacteria bacterium]